MKAAFILSFAANIVLAVVSLVLSPSQVAIHFGPGGEPDSWAPSYVNALIMTGIHSMVFACLFFSPRLMRKLPRSMINLPNKDYWLSEKRREQAEARMADALYLIGTATHGFLLIIGLLALHANLSTPVRFREDLFWMPFWTFIAFTGIWTILFLRKFRLPKDEAGLHGNQERKA